MVVHLCPSSSNHQQLGGIVRELIGEVKIVVYIMFLADKLLRGKEDA